MRKLEHHHLIDGKYLKEDVIPQLHGNIEKMLAEMIAPRLRQITFGILEDYFKQFEDECVAYDRSKDYVEKETTWKQ